jgi:recombinational DNA repair ATPase RecF
VIIGPRGSGKTSLIEVIRFCLGASTITENFSHRTREQILSILGDGRVTATIVDGKVRRTITRSLEEARKKKLVDFVPPLILAQNEIESIGIDASSRLNLLDGFVDVQLEVASGEIQLRSTQSEISSLARDIFALDEQLASLAPIAEELVETRKEQEKLNKDVSALAPQQKKLKQLSIEITPLLRESALLEKYAVLIETWVSGARKELARLPLPPEVEAGSTLPLFESMRAALSLSSSEISLAFGRIEKSGRSVREVIGGRNIGGAQAGRTGAADSVTSRTA